MFKDILAALTGGAEKPAKGPEPLHLATAALFLEVAFADGAKSDIELDSLKSCLKAEFGLEAEDIDPLVAEAQSEVQDATDFFRFTRVLAKELDQEGRQAIVKSMWRIALADDHLDNLEDNAVAKISGVLGVRPPERILLRQQVEAERAALKA